MDDLPAKEGYRSQRILDFARMGVAREPESSIDMALLVEGDFSKHALIAKIQP